MLFSTFSPPPRRGTSPWIIALGACCGCGLIAVLAFGGLSYFAFRSVGGLMKRTIAVAQFGPFLQRHQYARARMLLTPELQQTMTVDSLQKKEEEFEKKYGEPNGASSSPRVNQNPTNRTNPDFNAIRDFPMVLNYQRGTRVVMLTFDADPAHAGQIAQINWNADSASSSGENGSDTPSGGAGNSRKKPGSAHRAPSE